MTVAPVAYLVMAHHKPQQLLRLLERLRRDSPNALIALHFDGKQPVPEPARLAALDVGLIIPRITVQWGDYSMVEAVLAGYRRLLTENGWRYVQLISGQDYPLRPLAQSERALLKEAQDAYLDASPEHEYLYRYCYRYWVLPKFRHAYLLPPWVKAFAGIVRTRLNQSQRFIRLERRPRGLPQLLGVRRHRLPFSESWPCWFGSDWFVLSRQAVEYLLETLDQRPGLVALYRTSLIPSESLFATVLCNSPLRVHCGDNRRFILWASDTAAHPVTLTMEHLPAMIASGKDFGRKFDADRDSAVLDALDRILDAGHTLGAHDGA
ncbi:beta-1,6-N-acetylglucosaminyltransferase [Thiobacter aerophilum]|uniref:Peptide O-xylosyltransferase n=1 Tax=Thiobacter aerophilum TaxID=3121275 RepID=A0ABV0EDF4_9BURK